MAKGKRNDGPRRPRTRTKTTLTEGRLKVSLATHPRTGDRALEHDVELAKAALLYADEVEMIGLGVSMFENVRRATLGDLGMFGLLRELDDEALAFVTGQNMAAFPENWRAMLDLLGDPQFRALAQTASAPNRQQLDEALAGMDDLNEEARPIVNGLLEDAGAGELAQAIDAKVIRIADLDVNVSHLFRAPGARSSDTDQQVAGWVAALLERLNDSTTRLLFDDSSAELVQELLANGQLQTNEPNLRLARQAALGAGLIARLPAFPQAPMDELLDLRSDLTAPLVRYRGAVIRYSKELPALLGKDLEFEVEQLWEAEVQPAILDIRENMADHKLVRELARSVDAKDFARFTWTAGASIGVASMTDVHAFLLGAAAAAANLSIPAAIAAARSRGEAVRTSRSHEMYFLYEANRRLG